MPGVVGKPKIKKPITAKVTGPDTNPVNKLPEAKEVSTPAIPKAPLEEINTIPPAMKIPDTTPQVSSPDETWKGKWRWLKNPQVKTAAEPSITVPDILSTMADTIREVLEAPDAAGPEVSEPIAGTDNGGN